MIDKYLSYIAYIRKAKPKIWLLQAYRLNGHDFDLFELNFAL